MLVNKWSSYSSSLTLLLRFLIPASAEGDSKLKKLSLAKHCKRSKRQEANSEVLAEEQRRLAVNTLYSLQGISL